MKSQQKKRKPITIHSYSIPMVVQSILLYEHQHLNVPLKLLSAMIISKIGYTPVKKIVEKKILKDEVALNRTIENHCRKIAIRGIWVEMKEQSHNAVLNRVKGFTGNRSGILYLLTQSLKKLSLEFNNIEVHAMAHSVGSELLTTLWLKELEKHEIKLNSLHLLAPTISIQDSNKYLIKACKKGVIEKQNISIYILDKKMENLDTISRYSKSLLHLISRSLEKIHKTPLLELLDSWDDKNISTKDGVFNTSQLNELKKESQLACSDANDYLRLNHKNLDRSIFILDRVLKIVSTNNERSKLKYKINTLC